MPTKPTGLQKDRGHHQYAEHQRVVMSDERRKQNGRGKSSTAPMIAPVRRPEPTITMKSSRKAFSRPKIGGFTVLSTNA